MRLLRRLLDEVAHAVDPAIATVMTSESSRGIANCGVVISKTEGKPPPIVAGPIGTRVESLLRRPMRGMTMRKRLPLTIVRDTTLCREPYASRVADGAIVRIALGMFAVMLLTCNCAAPQSHIIVGKVRPDVSPDQVKVYLQPPKSYEQIAIIDASSENGFAMTQQQKMDKTIERLKAEAAKVGANGILLQNEGSQVTGSTNYGAIFTGGAGIGMSQNQLARVANGLAIFVI